MFSRLLIVLYQELANFYQISPVFPREMFVLIVQQKFALKTTLALSSIVYPVWLHCERNVSQGLSSGSGHGVMIPPMQ